MAPALLKIENLRAVLISAESTVNVPIDQLLASSTIRIAFPYWAYSTRFTLPKSFNKKQTIELEFSSRKGTELATPSFFCPLTIQHHQLTSNLTLAKLEEQGRQNPSRQRKSTIFSPESINSE